MGPNSIDKFLKYKSDSGKDIKYNPVPIPHAGTIEDFRYFADKSGATIYLGESVVYAFVDTVTVGTHSQRAMQWILNTLKLEGHWREHVKPE